MAPNFPLVKALQEWHGDDAAAADALSQLQRHPNSRIVSTAAYAVQDDDYTIFMDCSTEQVVVTLPHAADHPGRTVVVVCIDSTAGNAGVTTLDGDIISASTIGPGDLDQGMGATIFSDGNAAWWSAASNL